ncbi:MAG: hypothetical protein Q8P24_09070 [Desulfobacterales bacterium]|nr:hypothetical protein [Desulfobacterales bacterium]
MEKIPLGQCILPVEILARLDLAKTISFMDGHYLFFYPVIFHHTWFELHQRARSPQPAFLPHTD